MLGRVGKYELVEKLSEGGMGELFRARVSGPGGFERFVALKRIRSAAGDDPSFVGMFVEEAKVASLLSHQNLVHLYDFGSEGAVHFLAMEMVEGRDLAKVLARSRERRVALSVAASVRIAQQVAEGLDHLHRLNHRGEALQLVHRDVSPHNVMVSFDGAVKLTDFGIARMRRAEPLTRVGVIKGKIGYLTPEQVRGFPVDARSDLFSLGIVLWECLTGGRLFPGSSDAEVLYQVLERPVRAPSALNVDVPPELDQVVLRALNRDRQDRFQSAAELARALSAPGIPCEADKELSRRMHDLFPEMAADRWLGLSTSPVLERLEMPARAVSAESELPMPDTAEAQLPLFTGTTASVTAATLPDTNPPDSPLSLPPAGRRRRALAAGVALAAALVSAGALGMLSAWTLHAGGATVAASPAAEQLSTVAPKAPAAPQPVGAMAEAAAPAPFPTAVAAPALPTVVPAARQSGETEAHRAAFAVAAKIRRRSAPASASLSVYNVDLWAEVLVDGKQQDWFSPHHGWRVPAGQHRITLRNPGEGIEREFPSVRFPPGGTVTFRGELKSLQPEIQE